MTTIAKDYRANSIEWTCVLCGADRTFHTGPRKTGTGKPCPVCGERAYEDAEIVAVFVPNPEFLMPGEGCLRPTKRMLRVLPPVNAGYYEDGSATGEPQHA
jgi:hypothetical protein